MSQRRKKYHYGNESAKSRSTDRARPFDRAHPGWFYRRSGICLTFPQRRAAYAPAATAVYAPATAVYDRDKRQRSVDCLHGPEAGAERGALR
jgi:hypothetical protein